MYSNIYSLYIIVLHMTKLLLVIAQVDEVDHTKVVNMRDRGWVKHNDDSRKFVAASGGDVPLGAYVGGWNRGKALYLARVLVGNSYLGATLFDGDDCAYVYNNGARTCHANYQILTGNGYQWQTSTAHDTKLIGFKITGSTMFCRRINFGIKSYRKYELIGFTVLDSHNRPKCRVYPFGTDLWHYEKLLGYNDG